MRPLDDETRARLTAPVATLCRCWRIVRRDGTEIGLTDHDREIAFGGTRFRPGLGGESTAIESTADLAPDNASFGGILDASALGTDDLVRGRFDGAAVEIWDVDWSQPSARFLIKVGHLGAVERSGGEFRAEFRSLKAGLQQTTGRVYGRTCDAALGDARCGVSLSAPSFLSDGVVVTAREATLTLSGPAAEAQDGWFTGGALVIAGGALDGIALPVRAHRRSGGLAALTLWSSPPPGLVAGAAVRLTAGCDKRIETCRAKFGNALNFRGFADVPGSDVLTATAGGAR